MSRDIFSKIHVIKTPVYGQYVCQAISFGGSAFHGSCSIDENFNCLQVTFNCRGDVAKMKTTYLQIEGDNLKGNDGQCVVVIKDWPSSFQSQPSHCHSAKRSRNE